MSLDGNENPHWGTAFKWLSGCWNMFLRMWTLGSWLYLGHKSINCRHLAEWINQMPLFGTTSSSLPISFCLQGRASLPHLLHPCSLFWEEFLIASNAPLAHKLITTGADHQLGPGPTYSLSGGLRPLLPPWKLTVVHFPLQTARTSRPFTPWDLGKTGISSSSFVRLLFLFQRARGIVNERFVWACSYILFWWKIPLEFSIVTIEFRRWILESNCLESYSASTTY